MTGKIPYQFPEPVAVLVAFDTKKWARYLDRYRELLDNVEFYEVTNGEYPDDPEFLVIPGSNSSIFEVEEDWGDKLVKKTRMYIEEDIPILGICFGHQVIAEALGADIVRMADYEMGFRQIEMNSSPLFEGLDEVEYPFSTHQDKVQNLPDELRPIAESDRCVQAIEHVGKPVYGVQFHLDLTPAIMKDAIRDEDKGFDQERTEELLNEVRLDNVERAERTLKVFDNFREIALSTI